MQDFIDSATSLLNLADNLTEGIHKIKCKDCDCFLGYESAKCNKNYSYKIDEKFHNTCMQNKFVNTLK